jgi:ribosomal protein L11 methyltransferase
MAWLKLKLRIDREQAEPLGVALEAAGAISVTLEDAADEPLLETAWEAAPTWSQIFVTGLFPGETDIPALMNTLQQSGSVSASTPHEVETLPDQDWERVWMERYRPIQVGRRLWIVPSWCTPPDPDAVNVILDPGLAFGTGTHPTTALCLEWLSEQDLNGKTVIDYGCGSGILAVAALKLGAQRAIAVDIDARTLDVVRDNAAHNGVAERLQVGEPTSLTSATRADIVIANILAGPLIELAPTLTPLVRTGGALALSGLMTHQADEVCQAYQPAFLLQPRHREEWVLLAGRKRSE